MGIKGDKGTNLGEEAINRVIGILEGAIAVSSKKMFGGYGVFSETGMFCMVNSKGEIFLKGDEAIKSILEKVGGEKHSKMPYYSVPEKVLNDRKMFIQLAKNSSDLNS